MVEGVVQQDAAGQTTEADLMRRVNHIESMLRRLLARRGQGNVIVLYASHPTPPDENTPETETDTLPTEEPWGAESPPHH